MLSKVLDATAFTFQGANDVWEGRRARAKGAAALDATMIEIDLSVYPVCPVLLLCSSVSTDAESTSTGTVVQRLRKKGAKRMRKK